MSIEDSKIVDFISTDSNGDIRLIISDHLEWDNRNEHLFLLQEKLNGYLQFIESGELLESYPDAKERRIIIQIMARFIPNDEGQRFLEKAQAIVQAAGHDLKITQHPADT